MPLKMIEKIVSYVREKRAVILVSLLIIIVLLFPVKKHQQVTYIGDGGEAGSLVKERSAPWWLPESLLKSRISLDKADEDEVKQLVEEALKKKDIEKLKVIEKSYPEIHDVVTELEKELSAGTSASGGNQDSGSGGSQTGGSNTGSSTETTQPPPSTSAGGTLEARIPASIDGYKLITESRSLITWLGVFKSENDQNIVTLEVSIEMLGESDANKELKRVLETYGKTAETRVKGIKAYFSAPDARTAYLWFVDGDFFYEYKFTLNGSAKNYLEEAKKVAEKSFL